jgi:hypothetical protein
MADGKYRDDSLVGVDAVHDPVVTEMRGVFACEFKVERMTHPLRTLSERAVDELDGRNCCFLR